jgi:hypothetical protein
MVASLQVSQDMCQIIGLVNKNLYKAGNFFTANFWNTKTLCPVDIRYIDNTAILSGEGVRICKRRGLVFTCSASGHGEVSQ